MYNIPVLKTLNRGQGHSEMNEKKKKNHREFVVFDMQDIVQILQHNIPNNSQITHNYLPSKNTKHALEDSSRVNIATCIHSKL